MNIKFHWLTKSGGRKMQHSAKFRQNLSICYRISRFLRQRPLPSWILEILKCYWLTASGEPTQPRYITVPYFVKIINPLWSYCNFFLFSRWQPPPSWIFKILNFYWQMPFGGLRCITVPNFVEIVQKFFLDIMILNFQDGGHHRLGFQKFISFTGCLGPKGRHASSCHISSKSVNPLKRYCSFLISQDGGCRNLGFYKFSNLIS